MTPQTQKVFEDGKGDCFRSCVASILDLPLDDVPNFLEKEDWWKDARDWLDSRGLRLIEMTFADPKDVKRTYFEGFDYCILTGRGPRKNADGSARYHAVVGRADGYGVIMEHDPHPSRDGLLDEGYRWVRIIVKK